MNEPIAYVGPTLPFLRTLTIFAGGTLPGSIEERFATNPYLKPLFVPVSQLQKARAEVKTAGTHLHFCAGHVNTKEN